MYNQIIIIAPGRRARTSVVSNQICYRKQDMTSYYGVVACCIFVEHLCSGIRIRQQRGKKVYALREKVGRWHLSLSLLFLLNSNQGEVYASTHPGWLLSGGQNQNSDTGKSLETQHEET